MSSPSAQEGENGQGGLKRTGSRSNLAGISGSGSKGATSMAAFQAAAAATAAASSSQRSPANTSSSSNSSPGLLKRSRSMGTFDSYINRDTCGADAVEAISNRAIPTSATAPSPSSPAAAARSANPPVATPHNITVDTASSSPSSSGSETSLSSHPHDVVASPLDDSQLHHEPLARVDYFSHDWNESDLSSSWRYIVSRRQEMANSARLENASWRTWAKAKYNLKTVSPESLNWLKDYDVTWLYGPLYHEHSASHAGASSSQTDLPGRTTSETDAAAAAQATDVAKINKPKTNPTTNSARSATRGGPKSILKKKTLAQIMLEDTPGYVPGNTGSETTNYLRHHIYRQVPTGQNRERMAALLNRQYEQDSSQSAEHTRSSPNAALAAATAATNPYFSPGSTDGSVFSVSARPSSHRSISQASAASLASLGSTTSQGSTRRVHFCDRVEQCIALDIDESAPCSPSRHQRVGSSEVKAADRPKKVSSAFSARDEDYDDDDDDDDDDEDDEGGLFLGMRRHDLHHDSGSHTIIAPLPATTLKYEEDDLEPEVVVPPSSTQRGVRAGFSANYDYSSVYKIVDPKVKAVPMPDNNPVVEAPRKVQPVASFGLDRPTN